MLTQTKEQRQGDKNEKEQRQGRQTGSDQRLMTVEPKKQDSHKQTCVDNTGTKSWVVREEDNW